MKRTLIYIAIGLVVLVFVFYAGKRSANTDAKVEVAKAAAKLSQIQAKAWQDSARVYRGNWRTVAQEVVIMAHEIDSLEKRRMVNVTHITNLPVRAYNAPQLDSIWTQAFDK